MSNKNEITTLSHEQAYEEAERMTDVDRYSGDGCDVIRGMHPEWGPTVLIFPAMGDVLYVPVALAIPPEVTALKNVTREFMPEPV